MESDIQKSTIVILVILTLVVSVLGTWTVLSQISQPSAGTPQSTAEMRFTIEPPQHAVGEPITGNVAFTIETPGG